VRFLISGYYGFANLGDEALLAQIVAQLKTRYPHATIDVLSQEPAETAHEFGVASTPRADLGAAKRAIDRCDVFLSGGGGLLQNATSFRSLLYYAGLIRSAVRAGKKTMIFAQSIGPLDFWGRQTVKECCKGVTAATVRDERSRALLSSLLPGLPIELTADPVFLYDPPDEAPDLTPYGLAPESDPLVIVAVRKTTHFDAAAATLAAAVDRLSSEYGARVAFVPFGGQADAEASTAVIRKCKSRPALVELPNLDAIAAAVARARLVVGVRLHALILAVRFGIPFLAAAYDPKVVALCDDVGYPLAPLWTAPSIGKSTEEPLAVVDAAWQRHDELAALLSAAYVKQRALAELNFDALARVVGPA
jgi:polysaccharide pyruvyl transferase CsaB